MFGTRSALSPFDSAATEARYWRPHGTSEGYWNAGALIGCGFLIGIIFLCLWNCRPDLQVAGICLTAICGGLIVLSWVANGLIWRYVRQDTGKKWEQEEKGREEHKKLRG